MAWTQEDIDNLDEAFKSGANKVKHADKEVGFRSVEEYKALRELMQADILAASGTPRVMSAVAGHRRS